MLNSMNLNYMLEKQIGQADTLDPRSQKLFDKVLRKVNVIGKMFGDKIKPIIVLEEVASTAKLSNRHFAGSKTVAVKDIHGTVDRDGDFDYNFAPLKESDEMRWCKVASAMLRGIGLPPIELIQVGDEYFVKDGHHRISVARALGFAYLDAIVEVWS
jgi:hypothetical protein